MPRPLYDKIAERNASLKARFCMPGHCGENDVDGLYASAQYDWTEVEGLDNLLQSEIACSKLWICALFDVDGRFYLRYADSHALCEGKRRLGCRNRQYAQVFLFGG